MGKSSNKSKQTSAKNEATKKCTCDHPFQCSCGNRPERPSKGHKWDPIAQQWGGKGHKQKGASLQAAVVGQAEKVTAVGNVAIKQWQKLPSDILKDLCKKNGKGLPIYKRAQKTKDKAASGHRYTLVVPDTNKKDSAGEHDVELTPSLSVSNDEQAKEEAALLGLLYLFPKLPHERTLPEPYRSTFLGALKNYQGAVLADGSNDSAASKSDNKKNKKEGNIGNDDKGKEDVQTKQEGASNSVAKANTLLTANLPKLHKAYSTDTSSPSSYTPVAPLLTKAQIKEARQQHQREVQARIRKHEAIRNANKPMEVFMCASMRRRIERLLSGDSNKVVDSMEDDEEDALGDGPVEGEEDDMIQSYVMQRLVHEGFTPSQVRKAYRAVFSDNINTVASNDQDHDMDTAYEETLQYLCIHLSEDQLPIGFDPRGGTLDVVLPASKPTRSDASGFSGTKKVDISVGAADFNENYDSTIVQFACRFGITPKEASFILSDEQPGETKLISSVLGSTELMQKWKFWSVLCRSASLPLERSCFVDGASGTNALSAECRERNREAASNELEALEAIFDGRDLSTTKVNDDTISVTIAMPSDYGHSNLNLEVIYCYGVYPDLLPMVFLTYDGEQGNNDSLDYRSLLKGHTKVTQFLSTLEPGQEAIFELFSHVQELLQDSDGIYSSIQDSSKLLSHLNESNANINGATSIKNGNHNTVESTRCKQRPQSAKRPREKSTFWSTSPKDTPPAESFPKLSALLEKARKSLPAAKARAEFLSLMEQANKGGRVVLVTGETGCGKTTQIPQFILENSPNDSKIVVAQPRRLAATGVASRVATERGESTGYGSVGYSVRGDSKTCSATRLLFCTTGILLRQLQSQCSLDNISHIIIDEVHERHLDSDVLLAILKQILPSTPRLNVVLMSATMDADRFANYWGPQTPRMHIPGFTHPVKDFMLEDVLQMTGYIPPKKGTSRKGGQGNSFYQIQPSFVDGDTLGTNCGNIFNTSETEQSLRTSAKPISTEERIKRMGPNVIDYGLIAVLIEFLLRSKEDDGSILVFLPGAGEIERAERAINKVVKSQPIHVLPLHGGLQPEKQQQVFLSSNGKTKIILSTNVAETSITIPDCTVVIDTCKEKQSSFDPINRMPLLLERFASQDSLRQRRGRAGRVRPGVCYKLISRQHYNNLPEHGEPEIKRCALDQTILSLLFLGLEDGTGSFLSLMLDPPSQGSIDSALTCLEKVGAIERTGGVATLSPLGSHLAGIPAPPTVAKLLVMGCLLGCRKIALAIAAGMSVGRSPFMNMTSKCGHGRPNNDVVDDIEKQKQSTHEQILEARSALFQTVGNSDHLMLGKAYLLWEEAKGSERRKFCDRFGLALNIMKEMQQLVQQLSFTLSSLGFIENKECTVHTYSWRVVRAVVVSALAPAQIVKIQRPTTKYTETVEGAVEKEGKAKDLKFFIRGGENSVQIDEERVFIHPSCNLFSVSAFFCPWLVYHRMVRTSKPFIHDATEGTAYALLLFGGKMEVQASKGLVVLDDHIQLSSNARIGSLIGALRKKIDNLLEKKVADPSLDISNTAEMKLVADLLRYDGLGK
ncbi:hypothetical protein ACHAWX_006877 [Stephanocyclus meneghinianus]